MAKTKTSRKREFCFEDMPVLELRRNVKLIEHDPRKTLRNVGLIYEALMQSLSDGDVEAFKEILGAFLEVTNKDKFAKRAKVPKRTLFRMISPDGNPTLDTIAKVVHALKKAA